MALNLEQITGQKQRQPRVLQVEYGGVSTLDWTHRKIVKTADSDVSLHRQVIPTIAPDKFAFISAKCSAHRLNSHAAAEKY